MTAHVFVFGFVQGVGFRQLVKRKARSLALTGWIKNLPDGRVEAAFSGPKESIEEVILFCKKGPFLSEVKHVEVDWVETPEISSGFQILR
jgi:acylphosphatase